MFGLEILDIVIGLTFVYLLLALAATAINEYVSAYLNMRGNELAKGIARLLDDLDGDEAVQRALKGLDAKARITGGNLVEQFYSHRLIRPLATRRGPWWNKAENKKKPRLPSYIPARTFALALLDILGYHDQDANRKDSSAPTPNAQTPAAVAQTPAAERPRTELDEVLDLLKRESPLDVSEHLGGLKELLLNTGLEQNVRTQLLGAVASTQTRLQKLHDSTEVWFNNSMDRVSGAYKRYTQGVLFVIGLILAFALNADTIQMWTTLAKNDALRTAMANRAAGLLPALDTMVNGPPADTAAKDSTPAQPSTTVTDSPSAPVPANPLGDTAGNRGSTDSASTGTNPPPAKVDSTKTPQPISPDSAAKLRYLAARAMLDSMELRLGWTREDLVYLGLARRKSATPDSTAARQNKANVNTGKGATGAVAARRSGEPAAQPAKAQGEPKKVKDPRATPWWVHLGRILLKIIGLLMTGLAVSLGAPFWFDMLNKVISIRAAGRSPEERLKSPGGPAKRAAEQPIK